MDLFKMLSYKRPAGSKAEEQFILNFLEPLGVERDDAGNLHKIVGESEIVWSSHTDTVHQLSGRQKILISPRGIIGLKSQNSKCLGADCTAGVWLMTQMIQAGIPGHYVFHRAEEIGGKGSSWIAANAAERFKPYRAVIAFDRRKTTSIITHQWGGRCCSDDFARSLSAVIGLDHKLDPTGSFTDSANYTGIVGECTNVSVGFEHEHSKDETLDVNYLFALRDAMLQFDESKLTFVRAPGEEDPEEKTWYRSRRTVRVISPWADQSMYQFVKENPYSVAEYFEDMGITVDVLRQMLRNRIWGEGA